MKTNKDRLIKQAVTGRISHPLDIEQFIHNKDGQALILPGAGSITYNFQLGDTAFGWEGDHVEPGVSIINENKEENGSLMTLACIGNEATVVSGDAKGKKGIVIGSHLGIDHTIIHFETETLEELVVGDRIQIKAFGLGLKLIDHPDIKVMNLDPSLLERLDITEHEDMLSIPVAARIPSFLIGSGTGLGNAFRGDCDIMTQDRSVIKKYGIDQLRIGDFVLIEDFDCTIGRCYFKDAVTVGVIIHSDCVYPGHGPGFVTLFSSGKPLIKGEINANANLKNYISAK